MTFCVVIEQNLRTSKCPVPQANCMWRNRVTNECKYDEKLQGCDPTVLASIVSVPAPSYEELESIKAAIKEAVIKELS